MGATTPLDRLAAAGETGKVSRRLLDDLATLDPDEVLEQLAEALTNLHEAIETARTEIEDWAEAEDAEYRADARDRASEACEAVMNAVQAWHAEGWPDVLLPDDMLAWRAAGGGQDA